MHNMVYNMHNILIRVHIVHHDWDIIYQLHATLIYETLMSFDIKSCLEAYNSPKPVTWKIRMFVKSY